jgi:predicted ATPase/DNA-binding CsgD family transcriptional regulator
MPGVTVDTSDAGGAAATAEDALLERADAMSALEAAFADVHGGVEGRLVLLGGEAGIGKTVLLRSFCRSREPSVRVFWGECEPLLTPRPLGPLLEVAEACGGELAELVGQASAAHEIASGLVRELSGRRLSIVVLEDVHWADEATLDVLRLLARRVSEVPALVVVSFRDDELDRAHPLRLVFGELARRPQRLKLARLSAHACATLAAEHGFDSRELYLKTGGNPFFVTEVLEAPGERIPDTVRDAVLARAARLSVEARRLLDAVAVVPGQVEMWLLEAITREPIGQLEECLGSGVLVRADGGVAFRHELARGAIEESIAPDQLLALHRAALDALASPLAGEADPQRLAHHSEAIGDEQGVLRWAPVAAARAAAAGAHREAAAHYARALRFADRMQPEALAELLERHGTECFLTNALDDAIRSLEHALALRRKIGDQRRVANGLASLALVMHDAGRAPDAEALASEAVELAEPLGPSRELARAYAARAHVGMVFEDLEGTAKWGQQAVDLADELNETEILVHALTSLGTILFNTGGPAGREQLERALSLAMEAGLDGAVGRAFNNLLNGAVLAREFDHADRYATEGISFAEEHGLDLWLELLGENRMTLDLYRGRWQQAADAATHLGRSITPGTLVNALVTIGRVRARYGDPESREPLEQALTLANSAAEPQLIFSVAVARAEAAWLDGDSATVAEATDDATALAVECRIPWTVGELAYWRWQAGLKDDIAPELVPEPYRLSIEGCSAKAAERWREIGCPYEAALALAGGDDASAMRDAIEQLQQLGARPAAAIIARRLRERGVRGIPRGPRSRTRENPAGLTGRELEVLSLVVEGLRNAQIAERLVISEKTVDHHISAILRKLNVPTRGQASAEAARLGISSARYTPHVSSTARRARPT